MFRVVGESTAFGTDDFQSFSMNGSKNERKPRGTCSTDNK